MKKIILLLVLTLLLVQPVQAMDFHAPEVPKSGEQHMPEEPDTFAEGLWYVIKSAIHTLQPDLARAAGTSISIIAVIIATSLLHNIHANTQKVTELAAVIGISLLLLEPANTFIHLGVATVTEISNYAKLLIPVMTTALAAQGGVTSAGALYTATTLFATLLTNLIAKLLVPMVYMFLCMSIAGSVIAEDILKKIRDFIKWLMVWSLKVILYVFSGYIGITGVVSGSTDASMLMATKLTISGGVPVVGGILSDASETILISAGIMKNAAGVYGILAIIAILIGPFLKIGIHYILLKITAAVCGMFGTENTVRLMNDFSSAMGFVLAMISCISLLITVGLVCFMKGVI